MSKITKPIQFARCSKANAKEWSRPKCRCSQKGLILSKVTNQGNLRSTRPRHKGSRLRKWLWNFLLMLLILIHFGWTDNMQKYNNRRLNSGINLEVNRFLSNSWLMASNRCLHPSKPFWWSNNWLMQFLRSKTGSGLQTGDSSQKITMKILQQ
jgi:hypothetical protein